jgi:monovalent cation:H+ antiporter-2, CPA2 family
MLTPFAMRAALPLAQWYRRRRGAAVLRSVDLPNQGLRDHIIIAGYGRVGRYTADVLRRLKLPFVVIELDQHLTDQIKTSGIPVIYGDASSPIVLEVAGLHTARLALIAVSAAIDVELIVRRMRQINPELQIVARAARRAQIDVLRALGVHEVVQPEFEAGLEMVRQSLLHFDFPAAEIEHFSDAVRNELYQPFQTLHTSSYQLDQLRRARQLLEIEWVTLPANAPLNGQSIEQAAIRQRTGVLVVGVLRGEVVYNNPDPELAFLAGDNVAVFGTPEQRSAFRTLAAVGPDLPARGALALDAP